MEKRWKRERKREKVQTREDETRRGISGRGLVGARYEIQSFRWHFLERVCACRRPPSLDAASAIGLLQGSVLFYPRNAILFLCISRRLFLAVFLQVACWRTLDRQVALMLLVWTLTLDLKCLFSSIFAQLEQWDKLWSLSNYVLIILLLVSFDSIFREILRHFYTKRILRQFI